MNTAEAEGEVRKPASNLILLYVPRLYFCGGSYCFMSYFSCLLVPSYTVKKVQVGIDQAKVQSERDSHFQNRGGKKTKLTP